MPSSPVWTSAHSGVAPKDPVKGGPAPSILYMSDSYGAQLPPDE